MRGIEEETMQKRLFVTGSLIAMLAAMPSLGIRAQGRQPASPVLLAAARKERHPALVQAMRALQRAKTALQNANRDFGGHRAKALDLTNQAIQEVQAAIQSDQQ
jgi:hypothetical protein